jgi:hypothetical protein
LYITLDERKLAKSKIQDNVNIPVSFNSPAPAPPVVPSSNIKSGIKHVATHKQPICFYGHTTTSAYRRGKPIWHVSPVPPWPSVPPDRPLCQKCYQVHRTAALKGKSQHSFPHLFLYQDDNINPPNTGGASSSASTERPPG